MTSQFLVHVKSELGCDTNTTDHLLHAPPEFYGLFLHASSRLLLKAGAGRQTRGLHLKMQWRRQTKRRNCGHAAQRMDGSPKMDESDQSGFLLGAFARLPPERHNLALAPVNVRKAFL